MMVLAIYDGDDDDNDDFVPRVILPLIREDQIFCCFCCHHPILRVVKNQRNAFSSVSKVRS